MKKVLTAFALITLLLLGISAYAEDLVVQSKTQSYSETDNKIKAEGDVRVTVGDAHVLGDKADVTVKNNKMDTATFYDKPYAYEITGNKKREVKANILKVSLINKTIKAEGSTQTTVLDGQEPIAIITADEQEYDTTAHVMRANGGVIIHYKEIETFSNHAIIKTSKGGEIQKASADHFIYSPMTSELISMGNTTSEAILDDGSKLVLKAKYQEYNQNANTFLGSGNVRIWFKDYFAKGPKITFYPDKKTNKPNEIYFTGRSSITQDVKTIYADKIKRELKPKTFYAEVNTKTLIKNITDNSKNKENSLF